MPMDHDRMAAYLDSLHDAGPVSGGTSRRASGTSGTGGSFSGRSDVGPSQSGPPSPDLPPRRVESAFHGACQDQGKQSNQPWFLLLGLTGLHQSIARQAAAAIGPAANALDTAFLIGGDTEIDWRS